MKRILKTEDTVRLLSRYVWRSAKKRGFLLSWILVLCLGFCLRSAGLYRGLEDHYAYHPDETKQVAALTQYLNGYYVWYTGNLAYDGYPYGLNRVDEMLLRPVLGAVKLTRKTLGLPRLWRGDFRVDDLFVPGRWLRVLYGMLCVWLIWRIARCLSWPRGEALAAALAVALSPMSAAVSHFVTGDIGTDLFGACALLALCAYAKKPHLIRLFLAGAATGAAFACKYNGALVGIAIVLYLVLDAATRRSLRSLLAGGFMSTVGFVAAAVSLTPALFINPQRTLHDIERNFRYIRDYSVSDAFMALPWSQRLWLSWTNNLPRIVHALGLPLITLAGVGALWMLFRLIRPQKNPISAEDRAALQLRTAIFISPFLALAISLSGKPEVQPFHFSFLVIPLVLAAVTALRTLWISRQPALRILAVGLGLWWAGDCSRAALHEIFFWQREDSQIIRATMPDTVLRAEGNHTPSGPIKSIVLEPENPAVFRNRYHEIIAPSGAFWHSVDLLPVPLVSYPHAHDWIFANGPIFPRSDRMMYLPRQCALRRDVVFDQKPAPLMFGVRTGWESVALTLRYGGDRHHIVLAPESVCVVTLHPRRWNHTRVRGDDGVVSRYIVPLSVDVERGQGWLSLLCSNVEKDRFQAFNGQTPTCPSSLTARVAPPELVSHLNATRFLSRRYATPITVDADTDPDACVVLAPDDMALEGGRYVLEMDVVGLETNGSVTVQAMDGYGGAVWSGFTQRVVLKPGMNTIRLPFDKPPVPYQCMITLYGTAGRCLVQGWRVQPDYAAIIRDITRWSRDGQRPVWLGKTEQHPPEHLPKCGSIRVGGYVDIVDLDVPATVRQGESLMMHLGAAFCGEPPPKIWELAFFVHLYDASGKQVFAGGVPLQQSLAAAQLGIALDVGSTMRVPEGAYSIRIGVWNTRTTRRLPLSCEGLSDREQRERYYGAGTLRVVGRLD